MLRPKDVERSRIWWLNVTDTWQMYRNGILNFIIYTSI